MSRFTGFTSAPLKQLGVVLLLLGQLAALPSVADTGSSVASRFSAEQQARQAGVRTCLLVIGRLESWLTAEQSGSALTFFNKTEPDKYPFSALIALEGGNRNSMVSLNATPAPDGQCVLEYTQTVHVPLSCANHLKAMGNAARFVRDLNSKTALVEGKDVQILLMPVGANACLSLRKQIISQPGLYKEAEGMHKKQP